MIPHAPITDAVALFLSGVGTAGIIWFVIAGILFFREEKKNHWFFLPVLIAGGSSWILVERILKPWVGRLRPDGSGEFSFPSGHATIAFAMAAVLAKIEPRWKPWFYALAGLIAGSRVFLGKHYPIDIIAGAALGWGIGFIVTRRVK